MMGMYCCCEVKISGQDYVGKPQCTCDWTGWISCYDYPEDRKNKDTPIQPQPTKDGVYLIRWQDNCGDRYEAERRFSVKPIRIEKGGYFTIFDYPIHWEHESWEEGAPYAWKELE